MSKLYTIGYQTLRPARLEEIAEGLNAIVFDCRWKPFSRIAGFNMPLLKGLLGWRYEWHGDQLGGYGHVTGHGIRTIKERLEDKFNLILMCMEHAPGDCHRHHAITSPFFPDAIHIFDDELITSSALDESADYQVLDYLSNYLQNGYRS